MSFPDQGNRGIRVSEKVIRQYYYTNLAIHANHVNAMISFSTGVFDDNGGELINMSGGIILMVTVKINGDDVDGGC